ncbi:unnamed protein product [Scytosiphon promiscuus]
MRVFCRFRPVAAPSISQTCGKEEARPLPQDTPCIDAWTRAGRVLYTQGTRRDFQFTGCFGADATQEEVFNTAGSDVVDGVVNGYNGTIICAGRKGSGKSYTMSGRGPVQGADKGILARSLTRLFSVLLRTTQERRFRVSISLLNIYCERLQDVLEPSSGQVILIRERPNGETFLEGLSSRTVHSSSEALSILERADDGEGSNRSHKVALVYLERRCTEDAPSTRGDEFIQSCLMLADLAASENSKRTDSRYQRFEESTSINLGLSALGNCVSALAKRQPHVPYRDSKLTRLLQQTLGGSRNSQATVIVGILPESHRDELGETLATLVFAQRAMSVTMEARANAAPDLERRCQDLQRQVDTQSDELVEMTLAKAAADERWETAQDQIAQLREEKNATDARVQTMVEACDILQVVKFPVAGATVDRTHQEWMERVKAVKAECCHDVQVLKQGFEDRAMEYKREAAKAAAQCSSSEYELIKEKEAHLTVARDLRICQSEARKQERDTNHRVSELLSEFGERETVIEDLEARIRLLENEAREQNEIVEKEFVSRHKVEEMKRLFECEVEGLSNRLKDMEKRETQNIRQVKGIARNKVVGREHGHTHGLARRRSSAGSATFC